MATLTKKQRDGLADSDFGYVGTRNGEKVRLYPITDQGDVDSAKRLIGKSPDVPGTKKRIIAICKRKGLTPPDAWVNADSAVVEDRNAALFALDTSPSIRIGKIFETGDYPDQDFSLNQTELVSAIRTFTPIPIDFGHPLNSSPIDGLTGDVIEPWWEPLPNGQAEMWAAVAEPAWLTDLIPTAERKVSMRWDRETKQPKSLSYVIEPRIEDAALYAAFAKRHNTPQGQDAMQSLHDMAARFGAICKSDNADMASRHEATAMQQIHDLTADHGATCSAVGANYKAYAMYAATPPTAMSTSSARGGVMSWLQNFREKIGKLPDDSPPEAIFSALSGETVQGQPAAANPAAPAYVAGATVPDPKVAELQAEVNRLKSSEATRLAADAADFAKGEIHAGRALPAQDEELRERFMNAAKEDAERGPVVFAKGPKTRVEMLRADFAARPGNGITDERLRSADFGVIPGHREDPDKKAEEAKEVKESVTAWAKRNGVAK